MLLDLLPSPAGVVLVLGDQEDEERVTLTTEEARDLARRLAETADKAETLAARAAVIAGGGEPRKRRDGPRRRLWGQAFRPKRAAEAARPAPCPPASASPSAEAEA